MPSFNSCKNAREQYKYATLLKTKGPQKTREIGNRNLNDSLNLPQTTFGYAVYLLDFASALLNFIDGNKYGA